MRVFRLLCAIVAWACALQPASASQLAVDSSAFFDGGAIPPFDSANIMGCRGRNVSPPLRITGVPTTARSLAIVMFDNDAMAGKGFVHWVAYGIDPQIGNVPSGFGTRPKGFVGGRNDVGTLQYVGPCPPPGDPPHHYTISVYALALGPAALPPGLTRAAFLKAATSHELAVATIAATFGR